MTEAAPLIEASSLMTVHAARGVDHERKLEVDLSLCTGRRLRAKQDGRQNHEREAHPASNRHDCCLMAHRMTSLRYF